MFSQALTEIIRRLEEEKTHGLMKQYALIGGFAVSAWGVPRATNDFEFALLLGSSDPYALAEQLKAEYRPADTDDPLRGVFRYSLKVEDLSVPVQLILLPSKWEKLVFRKVVSLAIFKSKVPIVNWDALVLLMLYAGGPQNLLDAQKILAVRKPNPFEWQVVYKSAEKVDLLAAIQSLEPKLHQ